MGLDITAYSKLIHIGKHADDWCDQYDKTGNRIHVQAYAYSTFPQSFRGIPVTRTRASASGESTFFDGGCYALTPETQTYGFQAGSYIGYGRWRDNLAQQFNPARDADGPFYELIWFADNEGTIGPEAAADLLADFREHAGRYQPTGRGCEGYEAHFRARYADWTRACELAADNGLIDFH